jgi:hypothetical protein
VTRIRQRGSALDFLAVDRAYWQSYWQGSGYGVNSIADLSWTVLSNVSILGFGLFLFCNLFILVPILFGRGVPNAGTSVVVKPLAEAYLVALLVTLVAIPVFIFHFSLAVARLIIGSYRFLFVNHHYSASI